MRQIEADEQKLHVQKLQREAEKREMKEMDATFQHLDEQKESCWHL